MEPAGPYRRFMADPRSLTRRRLLTLTGAAVVATVVGCAPGSGPVEPLPADRLVLGVSSGPGFAPTIYWPLQSPALVAYGSGRILRAEQNTGLRAVPLAYTEATVDPLQVAQLVADGERRRVLERDFGSPQVTDLGSTRVWLQGAGQRREASIYAYGEKFDSSLSWRERRNRERLRAFLDDARTLIGDGGQPYVPERVMVLELRAYESSVKTTAHWPGPDPAVFLHRPRGYARQAIACGELTGDQAATVYAAARENPEQRWLVDGTTRVLAVNPLPVEIDC